MLIDTHAHLYWDSFQDDLDEVIQRTKEAGVLELINIGADLETSKKAVLMEVPGIKTYATVGIHPEEGTNLSSDESIHKNLEELEQLYRDHKDQIVAIGECGLDYHWREQEELEKSGKLGKLGGLGGLGIFEQVTEKQKGLFQAQITLAKKLNLPLIIHCRDGASTLQQVQVSGPSAWDDIFVPELKGTRGVFHTFTGTLEQAQKAMDLGYYLGFSCIVTYPKNEMLRQIIKDLPLGKMLVETDAPFLPPQDKRGQRNEPAYVVEVAKIIAELKNLTLEEVAQATFQNAHTLFNIA